MRFKFGPMDFTQPSTWRGIAGGAAVFGLSFSPELTEQIAIGLGAFLSAIEIFRNEHAARHAPLPPIELQSRAPAAVAPVRLRPSLPPKPETTRTPESPGFGDR